MTRSFCSIIFSFIFVMLLTGCSYHNGGDEKLWGTWIMTTLTRDGVTVENYEGNCFWKFQTDVVMLQVEDTELHISTEHFGTYEVGDDYKLLTLNFSHHDDKYEAGSYPYTPPSFLGLDRPISLLDIVTLTSKQFVLKHIDSQGVEYVYYLERWF